MSSFYIFINKYNIQKWDKKYVILNKKQISYPSEDVLKQAGIKPLVVEDLPQYDENAQYIEAYYENEEMQITQKWNVYDIPVDEEVIDDESITDA